jgi:hypothetical protein
MFVSLGTIPPTPHTHTTQPQTLIPKPCKERRGQNQAAPAAALTLTPAAALTLTPQPLTPNPQPATFDPRQGAAR